MCASKSEYSSDRPDETVRDRPPTDCYMHVRRRASQQRLLACSLAPLVNKTWRTWRGGTSTYKNPKKRRRTWRAAVLCCQAVFVVQTAKGRQQLHVIEICAAKSRSTCRLVLCTTQFDQFLAPPAACSKASLLASYPPRLSGDSWPTGR